MVRQANWRKVGGGSPPERRRNRSTFLREPCVGVRERTGEASVAISLPRLLSCGVLSLPPDVSRNVIRCHDPHARGTWPMRRLGMRSVRPFFPLGATGVSWASPATSAGVQTGPHPTSRASGRSLSGGCPVTPEPCSSVSRMSFLPPVSFHSVPSAPSPEPCGGTLFRAYRGGAVRAPDCARAPDARTQGTPVLSGPREFSRASAHRSSLRKPPRPDPYRHRCSREQA